MLRVNGTYAILIAFGMPAISVEILNDKQIAIDGALIDIDDLGFEEAVAMIEESAQANLDQTLTLLARKFRELWKAKPPDWIVR